MSDCKKKPKLSKMERRAQALRENLRKRKLQQRTRDDVKTTEEALTPAQETQDNSDTAPLAENSDPLSPKD